MKLKKSLFTTILVFFITCSSFSQPVKKYGHLKVEGVQLLDSAGNPVVLRGMSYGWHNWWPRFYNEGTVEWLYKDWECSVLRAAMGVEPKKGGYLVDSVGSIEKIKTVVDAAIKNGVYVIIDWHSHGLKLEEAKIFFSYMAKTYGSHPNIIYEIFNEPVKQSWEDVKNYSIEVIKSIREHDPDNVILVGCPHWDQDIHIVADDPIIGQKNIMYTVHFYAATHKKYLRDRCKYALKKNIPIFVSECAGMKANGDGKINKKELNAWIKFMEKNKISWVFWSVADKDESCSVLLPQANSEGNWPQEVIKEWGQISRKLIKKYN